MWFFCRCLSRTRKTDSTATILPVMNSVRVLKRVHITREGWGLVTLQKGSSHIRRRIVCVACEGYRCKSPKTLITNSCHIRAGCKTAGVGPAQPNCTKAHVCPTLCCDLLLLKFIIFPSPLLLLYCLLL